MSLHVQHNNNKGQYENTSLDGLNVVAVFHTPGSVFTGPKWKAALYLDDKANKEQADSLGKIFSGQAGGFFAVVAGLIGELAGSSQCRSNLKYTVKGEASKLRLPLT